MTTTVGNYDSETSDLKRKTTEGYIYARTLVGSTASNEAFEQLLEYQSLSMVPPRPQEQHLYPVQKICVWISYETYEERLEDAPSIRVILSWAEPWQHKETEPEEIGGVYTLSRERPTLFSQELELRTADLPHRQPRITITPRMLAREEDD